MISEFVTAVILGVVVFGGLAFHDVVVERIVTIDRGTELLDSEDLE